MVNEDVCNAHQLATLGWGCGAPNERGRLMGILCGGNISFDTIKNESM